MTGKIITRVNYVVGCHVPGHKFIKGFNEIEINALLNSIKSVYMTKIHAFATFQRCTNIFFFKFKPFRFMG